MTTSELQALHVRRQSTQPPAVLLGVDGGGSTTRVRLADANGRELAVGRAGASGLSLGIESAWAAVEEALAQALASARLGHLGHRQMAIGLGLAGAMNERLALAFIAQAPEFAALALDSDAYTTLLGAHGGCGGAIVAVGTGCVGMAWTPGGERRFVNGWGFPSGDEGGGAWMGLQALAHLERSLDGREPAGPLAQALAPICGTDRPALAAWLSVATQTDFAALVPTLLSCASEDSVARDIVHQACRHIERTATALDPTRALPIALCGGLAPALKPYLGSEWAARATPPAGDAAQGALRLITSVCASGPAVS